MTRAIDYSKFDKELGSMLDGISDAVTQKAVPRAVRKGIRAGAEAWRENAKGMGWSEGDHTYRKHGKTYVTGDYVKSIRSHMVRSRGPKPYGEVGSQTHPGLTHLLEFGHAKVGGGMVKPFVHVEPSAETAFEVFTEAIESEIGVVLDEE